ncbi:tripartite-type tricarboxylate transporter receptor subunit TctC [Aliiruegeria haliotis]|uniref:Tripartite-type tricarboxylate transporter receptor subunit TctC n=1 Tax=Aliiruegeria haliotis TaxID=1280846 RepID=A0A2T0RFM2_9RHOB|nr:tripartite tricarboxylate transporter substrate binding protein [Aliiruegeria haliotis]PRY19955.1 tripartite-type tricarboxylate transporter receptor subunit TctC [Aliiruegeria haliotis]
MKKTLKTLGLAAILAMGSAMGALADYPEKPIKFIVPYGPGGASDVVCRILAKHLGPILDTNIAVVNVDGAGGALAWNELKQARNDGYTLSMWVNSMAVGESTGKHQLTHEQFEPISQWGAMYVTMFAKGEGGKYETLEDFANDAKANPGQLGIAMGYGTPAHFVSGQIRDALGIDVQLVNVGAGQKKKAAVLGEHVAAGIEPLPGTIGQHRADQLRILAVFAPERLTIPGFEDLPIARDYGADVVAANTYAVIGPKGMDPERVKVISDAIAALADDAEYQEAIANVSFAFDYLGTEDTVKAMDKIRAETLETGKNLGF